MSILRKLNLSPNNSADEKEGVPRINIFSHKSKFQEFFDKLEIQAVSLIEQNQKIIERQMQIKAAQ